MPTNDGERSYRCFINDRGGDPRPFMPTNSGFQIARCLLETCKAISVFIFCCKPMSGLKLFFLNYSHYLTSKV